MSDHPDLPLVYAVVPVFNRCEKTLAFLRQFEAVSYPNKRVVICDDGSTDNTSSSISLHFPLVQILRGNGNLWWAGSTNAGVRHALAQGADYILTINDDCRMDPDFLSGLIQIALQDPGYIVGCRLMFQDEPTKVWAVGTTPVFRGYDLFSLNYWGKSWPEIQRDVSNPCPVATMPGNGVLIPRKVFEQIGFYDEKHMPQYHGDSDLVLRAARAGYKPVISLNSVLYNHIPTAPLVKTRLGIIFSKKSDRYWKANWTTLRRHGPFGKRLYLLAMQYVPFFVPKWAVRLYRRMHNLILRPPRSRITSGTTGA